MKYLIIIALVIYSTILFAQTVNKPFPQHISYTGTHIKPNNYSQTELDNHVTSFYDEWKTEYLKNDCGNSNEYYVFSGNGAKNVSEAQGYGMMITAFMAGYDSSAKLYFDGLYNFYQAHPSYINSHLMDWQQVTCNDSPSYDDDAASDGDIDIAFALLLAHQQWGSNGNINYLAEAQTIINAIHTDELNLNTMTVKLGDWCNSSEPNYYNGTRSSDFITDHFRSFAYITNSTDWNEVIDTCYSIINTIQTNNSPVSGLMPDFIVDVNTSPVPAAANYLEDIYDGSYYYNACRFPWRIGTDYLLSGDTRAKAAINKINTWLLSATSGNVNNISNGYYLNGSTIYSWNDATFTAPFTVGAMADTTNQTWLNNLYTEVLINNPLANGDYYSNTIKLLCMITISGNYWLPYSGIVGINPYSFSANDISVYPNSTNGNVTININGNAINYSNCFVRITDISGKEIIKSKMKSNELQIDLSTFRNGNYFISIIRDNKIIKVFKEVKI